MTLLPALTIGLMFGLVIGVLVYYVIGYFEAVEVDTQKSPQNIVSTQLEYSTSREDSAIGLRDVNVQKDNLLKVNAVNTLSSCIVVILNGKAKIIDIPPSE